MKTTLFLLLIMGVFTSDESENVAKSREKNEKKNTEDLIVVKIEEDEYVKKKVSDFIGVTYNKRDLNWCAQRWSKNEKKLVFNGYYECEGTAAHASDTLGRKLVETGEQGHKLNFPYDDTVVHPEAKEYTSEYIGVSYNQKESKWFVDRWSKIEKKTFHFGCYENEVTAAHASDTLARKLMETGEQFHKLNFPDDDTEVHRKEKQQASQYFGVTKRGAVWQVQRRSKNENKMVYHGRYEDEETAAQASDTLARKLMEKGEQGHKLNFPDDNTEVYAEEKKTSSKYFGVSYNKKQSMWCAYRRNKNGKFIYYGYYGNEVTAAHASDTLARKLIKKDEGLLKLNFPDDDAEVHPEKKYTSKYFGVTCNKNNTMWIVQRWSKIEKKIVHFGYYKNEVTAAHASDTLARKLMETGEQGHKLNLIDTQAIREEVRYPKKKRKREDNLQNY